MFSQQASNTISRQPSNITALSSVSKDFTVEHPSSVELQLNDSNLLAAYDEFAEVSQPIFARNLFLVAILLIHSFALILSYIPEFRDNSISSVENGLLGLAVVTVIASVLFAACAYKARKSDTSKASVFIRKFISCSGLYSLFALSFTVSLCSHLLMRAVAGQCQKTELRYTISCNPLDDKARLPDDILLATLVMPFFYSVILRVHWRTLLATVVIIIGALLTGGLIEKLYLSLQYVAIFIPLMLVVLHEHQRQTMAQFYIALKQQALIQENERLAEDVHAQEMRHMIANVAHDLKTPLAAFLSGVELIGAIATELDEKIAAHVAAPSTARGLSDHNDKHHDSKGEVKSSNTSAKSNPSSPERLRSNSFDSRKFEMHKEELVLNLKNSSSSSNINGVSSKAVGQEALNFSNNRIRFGINGSLFSDSNPHSDVDSLAYSRANSTIEPKEVDYLHLIDSVVVDESGCSSNTHESSIKREKLSSNNDFNNISSSSSHSLVEGANNGAANQPTAASNSWSPTNGMEEGAVAGVRSFSKHRSQSDFSTYSIVEDSLLADISDGLNVIHKNVVSTNNINKFMLMTINRCIDYTKASKGIPLIPKLEVLSTNELYKLVTSSIHCMQDMQTRVSINYHLDLHNIDTENATLGFRNKSVAALLGHSNNINNCVNTEGNLYGNEKTNGNNLGELYSNEKYVKDTTCRTDKQWLQDNLLCLLSNAVKYSLRGRVELAVFVVSEKEKNALLSLSVQSDADNLCDEADSEEERESNALLDGTYSLMPYSRDGVNVPDYDSQSDNVTIPTEMCSPHVGSKRTRERLSHSSSGSLATDYYPDILNAEHRNLAGSSDSFTKEEHDNLRIDSDDWRPDLEGQQARYSPVSSAMSESSSGSILQKFVSWTMGNSSSYASPRENTMPDPWSQSEGGIAMEPGQGMAVRQKPKPVNLLPPKRKLIPLKSSQAMLSGVEEHQLKEKKVKINDEKDMFLGSLLDEKIHPHSTRTLRIEVADSGRLLPESILSTIFSPSKQAERGEAQGGTGIGLFSLAVRVESLGGAYGAFPRKDGQAGTVFWFEIPLYSTSYNYFFRSHNNMNNQSNRKLIRSRPSSIRNNNMVASKSGSGSSKSYYSSQVDYTNTTGSASVSLSKQNSPSPQFLDADTSNGDDKVFGVSDSCFTKSSKNASMSVNAFVSGNHSTKAEATNGSAFAPSAIGNSDASEKEKAEVSLFESEGNHNGESDKNVGEECLFTSHGNMNDALNFARIGADTAKTYRSSFNCHVTPNNTRSPPSTRGKRRSSVGAPVTRERYESTRKSGAERKLRILFVDDSLPILKMISLMLSRQGHTVEQAENGQIAVDLVARRQSDAGGETLSRVNFYDVILMDLQMPVLDGIGAIQKIREMECDKVIHSEENSAQRDIDNLFDHNNFHNFIIAVSANSDSQTSANALAAGANHFLAKPFTLDAFDELVNSHFKKSIPDSNSCSAHSRDSLKGSLANGQSSDSEGTSMKTRVCEGEGILQQIGTSIVPDQEQKLSKSDHCRNARNSKVKANKIQNSRPDIHERLADEEAKTVVLASSSLM